MKKLSVFLILLLLLSGCTVALPQNNIAVPSSAPSSAATQIPLKTPVTYKSDFASTGDHDWNTYSRTSTTVITSIDQVSSLKKLNYEEPTTDHLDNKNDAYDYLNKYNESSFTDDNLVLIAIYVSYHSQPTSYSVDSVVDDGKTIDIDITRNIPLALADAEGQWVVFVELYDFDYSEQTIDVNIVDERGR